MQCFGLGRLPDQRTVFLKEAMMVRGLQHPWPFTFQPRHADTDTSCRLHPASPSHSLPGAGAELSAGRCPGPELEQLHAAWFGNFSVILFFLGGGAKEQHVLISKALAVGCF